jgi:formate hydrogenlyase transcriptional activator
MKVDVRLVAATNVDLAQKVADNQYRIDLYYRLNVFPVTIPPLRERREDIPLLVRYFAQKYARRMKRPIDNVPTKAMTALSEYHWPGNVRELETPSSARLFFRPARVANPGAAQKHASLTPIMLRNGFAASEHAEREHIVRTLKRPNG